MKVVKTEDAVGLALCHDIAKIIPGKFKGNLFKRGHVVTEKDIHELLKVGKENLYVWEASDNDIVHEDDAALFLAELLGGDHMIRSGLNQGRIDFTSAVNGLFISDTELLYRLNSIPDIAIAARHHLTAVRERDTLFATRVIPLAVKKEALDAAARVAEGRPVFSVRPYMHKKVAIVTTGSEVYKGLIEDGFAPVLRRILADFDTEETGRSVVPDEPSAATKEILRFADKGADVILVTGGMSVDPDDKTPLAIKDTGADIVTHGTPVLPGSMFMLAYLGEKAIIGVPGGVLFSKRTALDLILPRVMADLPMTADDFARLGNGGFCFNCGACIFPNCGFGAQ
jgi:molybdenum cofactor synthesis domain-containing protein